MDLLTAVGAALGRPVHPDDWRPTVQGAVGQVTGVRDEGGTPYVVKVFPAATAHRADTEVLGLALAGRAGAPVPMVVARGDLPGAGALVVLTRLEGVRWSDRRDTLASTEAQALHREVAALLRTLHTTTSTRYGDLLAGAPVTALERLGGLATRSLTAYVDHGGPPGLARRVHDLVRSREATSTGPAAGRASLCHDDVNGGNVLVTGTGPPHVVGLVDLERASWDDPLRDVALTALHLWHHDEDVEVLLEAYGLDPAERPRLEVHLALRATAERAWVCSDRPEGWRASAARLDDLLDRLTAQIP